MTRPELSFFGPGTAFHHIGIAVTSISEILGTDADATTDATQGVTVAFAGLHGVPIELVEPATLPSPVDAALRRSQPLVHLCFEVENLEAAFSVGRSHGFRRLGRPTPAPALDGRRIAWVFSRVFGLVELVER